jgi:hypothetical protein
MEANDHQNDPPEWVQGVKARGLGGALGVALDVLEPLGPLGAQVMYIAQPLLGVFLPRGVVGDIAHSLESPGGVEQLRKQLEE